MPTPKNNLLKIQRILNAWETLAPDKTFGGMTLTQFRAAAQPSLDARQRIDDLEDQLTQAQAENLPFDPSEYYRTSVKRRFVSSDFLSLVRLTTNTRHLFSEFHVSLLSALSCGRSPTPGALLDSVALAAPSF